MQRGEAKAGLGGWSYNERIAQHGYRSWWSLGSDDLVAVGWSVPGLLGEGRWWIRTLVPMTVAPVGSKTQTLAGKQSLSRRLCAGLLAGRRVDRVVWNQLFIGRVQKGGKDV